MAQELTGDINTGVSDHEHVRATQNWRLDALLSAPEERY